MEREFTRVVARLDVLHGALADRPTDTELLAEARGQQRALISLSAALAKAPAPVQAGPRGLTEAGLTLLLGEGEDARGAS
jgi:hypothetical protein